MNEFSFVGTMPASKSMLNRALVVQSYFPHLFIEGESDCDDVKCMRKGIKDLLNSKPVDCGHGGTVLRFLALRAARLPGQHLLKGSKRLFSRPMKELVTCLHQLSCKVEQTEESLLIKSEGWHLLGDSLHVSSGRSSQFATAALINAWNLDSSFAISPGQRIASPLYWQMSLKMMRQLGMQVERYESDYIVLPKQKVTAQQVAIECDLGSAFALAALAAVQGEVVIKNFPQQSLQPDYVFTELLKQMGAEVSIDNKVLKVSRKSTLAPVEFSIDQAPDLFPVLAVLCSFAKGRSELHGGQQLRFKESNRLKKVAELLNKMGKQFEVRENLFIIQGDSDINDQPFSFSCDQDHRMAMAAGLAIRQGYSIKLDEPHCVNKSFPNYWQIVGVDWQS